MSIDLMSEYKRANAFGTGYLDTSDVFRVTFKNETQKIQFQVAGDEKALEAFNEIPNEPSPYHYVKDKGNVGVDEKDHFVVEIQDPDRINMQKTCSYETYMKIINKYNIVSEGKWKEWGKTKTGAPKLIPVQR